MSVLIKGTLGLAATGTTAVGAAYDGGLFDRKAKIAISKLLQSFNPEKRLITATEGSDPAWKETWKSYKTKYRGKSLDPFRVLSGTTMSVDEPAPSDFLSSCKNLLNVEVVDEKDDSYQLVLNYCTRLTLVSDWISDRGNELVSQSDATVWKELWKKYKETGKNSWNLSEYNSYQEGQDAPASFKKKCSDESLAAQGNKYDSSVENIFLFCSKKKTS
ncbi:hypothetical protein MHC_01310 [Mycoplasma haemocanis str. Illinois]|uniref:Uncharacterized protein n=1 Tax=Mycoplasma haemocanis (strain Illinois) TaxID=1111676 RepID=H6N656_MYCHN|nr:hypothetical protein [Mycoplasma haemocanis]AEW45128.1 hypothetical protein MHC_01310 [Mycoplasma haemocanis str. Illinois]